MTFIYFIDQMDRCPSLLTYKTGKNIVFFGVFIIEF